MTAPLRDVPQEGIELIKSFEGIPDGDPSTVNLDAYLDPVGIWTIGWGHAITYHGEFLRGPQNRGIARALYPGGITLEQAEMLLRGELVNFARDVLRLAKVPLDDGQFAALVSFAFNCGSGNLGNSTLLRKLNRGDYAGAAEQFLAWNKARRNGVLVELPGLTRRRRAERALFLGEDWRAASALRTRGAAASPARTLAPERPEPPEPEEEIPAAAVARRPRRPAPALPTAAVVVPPAPPPVALQAAPVATPIAAGKPAAAPKGAPGKTAADAKAAPKAAEKKPAVKKPAAKKPAAAGKPAAGPTAAKTSAAKPRATKPPMAGKAATKKAVAKKAVAKKSATPRGQTTTPKAPPKAPRAGRPAPRTRR